MLTLQETRSIHDSMNRSKIEGVLAVRRIFSLGDMITNTTYSNNSNCLKIGAVHSKQQNTFQSDPPLTIP